MRRLEKSLTAALLAALLSAVIMLLVLSHLAIVPFLTKISLFLVKEIMNH